MIKLELSYSQISRNWCKSTKPATVQEINIWYGKPKDNSLHFILNQMWIFLFYLLFQVLFDQVNPIETKDLFYKGNLAKKAAVQLHPTQ